MEVNEIIRKRRLELGLTMKDVAEACNVTEGMVSRWESGYTKNMRRDRIYSLSQILQVSPLVILGMKDYEEEESQEDRVKKFTDVINTMSEAEQDELENMMNYIISKRK